MPDADTQFYKDTYDFLNHATGHSTIPGLSGGGVGTTYGAGIQAIAARAQADVDFFTKSGSPLPWDAGARAEAVKRWMALGGVITATNALGSALGGSLNLPFNLGSIKAANIINPEGAVASNLFKVTTTNALGTAKTDYGNDVGESTMLRYLGGMGLAIYHGDTDAMKSLTTSFMRGEAGPIPGWGLDMVLGNEWRNGSIVPYGPKGGDRGMSNLMHDLNSGFISRWANIGVKNLVDSMNAYGIPSGLIRGAPALGAGEVNTTPINSSTQAFKYVVTPDVLQKANLPSQAKGLDWNEMLSTEKASVTNVLKQTNPELIQQIQDATRERTPAIAAHADTVDQLRQQKNSTEDGLLDKFNSHQLTGAQVRSAMKATNTDYFNAIQKSNQEPGYLKEVNAIKSSGQDPTKAQNLLDHYYQITADDPKQAFALRNQFLASVIQDDPNIGERLLVATQSHQNESKLQQLYTSAEPVISAVFSKEGADRTAERRAHPDEDALVNFLGYESRTLTPQAEQLLNEMRATQGNKR